MLKKLRLKLICFMMALISVTLCMIFLLLLHFTRINLEKESMLMMQKAGAIPSPLEWSGDTASQVQLPCFTVQISPMGEIMASGNSIYDLSDKTFLKELADIVFSSLSQSGTIDKYQLRYLHVMTPGPGGERLVFSDISREQNTLRHLFRTCIFVGLFSLMAFFFISMFLARWAVKPVAHAWEEQRRFVADASHDLKTPLTVIRTNAEMLQSGEFHPDDQIQLSDNILTMSCQMQNLVEGMLELARTDQRTDTAAFSKINLSDTMQHALLPFEPVFFEKHLELESSLEPDIFVNGNAAYLEKLLDILLDNAAKYSFPKGKTSVSLTKSGNRHCTLTVSNPGETISPQDQKNIFKRFYRADKARTQGKSYGLGLSIAENIVLLHKGKISCESSMNVNIFSVRLPLC